MVARREDARNQMSVIAPKVFMELLAIEVMCSLFKIVHKFGSLHRFVQL